MLLFFVNNLCLTSILPDYVHNGPRSGTGCPWCSDVFITVKRWEKKGHVTLAALSIGHLVDIPELSPEMSPVPMGCTRQEERRI